MLKKRNLTSAYRLGRQSMSKCYMITLPREEGLKMCKQFARINTFIWNHDIHKWVIGAEKGKKGYNHWQIRMMGMNQDKDVVDKDTGVVKEKGFFSQVKEEISQKAHVEVASDHWEYERKEGMFWAWDDTKEVRQCRFGHPRGWQREVINNLMTQSDRQIDFIYNPKGNEGKSWLTGHLYETGKAWIVDVDGAEHIPRDVANLVEKRGYRPIVVFDIPRTSKATKQDEIFTALEKVKDGLITDARYSCSIVHIRGVKVIVFSNKGLDFTKLSDDRWRYWQLESGKLTGKKGVR
nr:MAG: replication associated protein [ssDNA virus sp.]